jgi:hypothetical protein
MCGRAIKKIGDRLQIAQQNANLLAALTAPIWSLSPIFNARLPVSRQKLTSGTTEVSKDKDACKVPSKLTKGIF